MSLACLLPRGDMWNRKSGCSSRFKPRECANCDALLDRERALLRDGTGTHYVQAISDQLFEKLLGPGITLFSGTFYLIFTENDTLLCHFILHCGVQESSPTVKPGLAATPTTHEVSCVSLLLCLSVAGKSQHCPRTDLCCYETKNISFIVLTC